MLKPFDQYRIYFSLLFFFFLTHSLSAQLIVKAVKINTPLTIDAILDEEAWANNDQIVTDFITQRPKPGMTPAHPTFIKLNYDDEALYVGAFMKEPNRDSIMTELTVRDEIGNTDFIGVIIDTYGNGNSAFEFILASTGVQFDAKVTPFNEDSNWDAVWSSATRITDEGWYAEIKIPYSAIRFQNQPEQQWNANFFRRRAVTGEQSTWHEIDPEANNAWLTNVGTITGIKNIKPPVRLNLSPYASVYGLHSRDKNRDPINSTGLSYNLGMDVKYGLTDAYTLDMTLIPDFGQVQSDDAVLNLSPFEVRFSENRPFFTEGLEIFQKANIFYSRRVGNNQQLYNATKISGRNKNGLGIGIFNAVAAEDSELVTDPVSGAEEKEINSPLSNYNIAVVDKDLKNNSSISFINTNVLRRGLAFRNANVTATSFNLKNKGQSYGISGNAAVSQLYMKESRNIFGHDFDINIEKLSGKFTFGTFYREISKDYDSNDLGFLLNSNSRRLGIYGNFRKADGLWKFLQFNSWFNARYTRNIQPESYDNFHLNTGWWAQTKKFWNLNMWFNYRPSENNIYEPRVEGRFFKKPGFTNIGYWFGSDNRKKLRIQSYGSITSFFEQGWTEYEIGPSIRYRFSNQFNVFLNLNHFRNNNEKGYVNHDDNNITFGKRDRRTFSNVIGSSFIFNAKMGIDLRLRHYWSKVYYKDFYTLGEDGDLQDSNYGEFSDFSYNALALDLNFRWRFAPGSEFIIVWKDNISGEQNDQMINFQELNYSRGIKNLNRFPQNNSLSLRLVYFIDYNTSIRGLFDGKKDQESDARGINNF